MERVVLLIAVIPLAAVGAGAAEPTARGAMGKHAQKIVDEATIVLTPGKCAGVIVGDQSHAITAAHCIGRSREVAVELHDGERLVSVVERLEREEDVALLRLERPVDVVPLLIASEIPRLGEALYFGGRRDREGSEQVFAVVKIGRCPSLPRVEDAIFTNLRARKGDSGAPLVNRSLEVVALVHGGARCNIAAPIVGFELGLGRIDPGSLPGGD